MSRIPGCLKVSLVDLDGKTVPDWAADRLESEGVVLHVHQCETRQELAEHAGSADVVWLFGGKRILHGNLDVVPACWAIVRTGSGTDNVPVVEATLRGVLVANTPAAFSDGVSDHTIALLFAVLRRIPAVDRAVRQGYWNSEPKPPLNSVQGRTLGLVGFGHVSRAITRKLAGFGLRVLVFDPYVNGDMVGAPAVEMVSLDALLSQSDFVSLHCPLTEETRHLIGERALRLMKRTAILLNSARGAVVDEAALARALAEGWIAGAGLDVLEHEPPTPDNPLLKLDNVVLTSHVAGDGVGNVETRWRLSVETVIALAHRQWPQSCVNPSVRPRVELVPRISLALTEGAPT